MAEPISFPDEPLSNRARARIAEIEARGQRTYTPTQAVLARSEGIYHYTPEGRRLADFTSGVLVANLGHHPPGWWERVLRYLALCPGASGAINASAAPPLTAYNAITPVEVQASERLLASLRRTAFGGRLEKLLWAASGSEGIQKAIWAALAFQPGKDIILATRHGFHGKKGLAEAVTGDENAPRRDPCVRFLRFPREECRDLNSSAPFDASVYRAELDSLAREFRGRINCLVTEPYLGGGGSYHPPPEYLRLLVDFCRANGVIFILDEVQSNFGRTGSMYAFESHGIEPDIVVLGKGLGNGVPVNVVAGRGAVLESLDFGGASDTWSGHPLGCAAVLATLDHFESTDVLKNARATSQRIRAGLIRLRELPVFAAVRGEGMVWGIECASHAGHSSQVIAQGCVRAAYLGDADGNGVHLLGPLAGNVLRIAPPLTMTQAEADHWMEILYTIWDRYGRRLGD